MYIKKFENFTIIADRLEDEIKALSFILEDHGTKVNISFGEVEDTEIIDHKIIIEIESEMYKNETFSITLWEEICRLKDPIIEYVDRIFGIIDREKIKSKILINLNDRIWLLEVYYSGPKNGVNIIDLYMRKLLDRIDDWDPESVLKGFIEDRRKHRIKYGENDD